jgi:hypothetical protein
MNKFTKEEGEEEEESVWEMRRNSTQNQMEEIEV